MNQMDPAPTCDCSKNPNPLSAFGCAIHCGTVEVNQSIPMLVSTATESLASALAVPILVWIALVIAMRSAGWLDNDAERILAALGMVMLGYKIKSDASTKKQ